MGLQGNLADLPFQDLVSSILRNKRNAQQNRLLVVTPPAPGYKASIIFHDGLIYAAWITCKSPIGMMVKHLGDDVMTYLMKCESGEFVFGTLVADYVLPERNIHQDYHYLSELVPASPPPAIIEEALEPAIAESAAKAELNNPRAGATKMLSKAAVTITNASKNQANALTGLLSRFRQP